MKRALITAIIVAAVALTASRCAYAGTNNKPSFDNANESYWKLLDQHMKTAFLTGYMMGTYDQANFDQKEWSMQPLNLTIKQLSLDVDDCYNSDPRNKVIPVDGCIMWSMRRAEGTHDEELDTLAAKLRAPFAQ